MSRWRPSEGYHKWVAFMMRGEFFVLITPLTGEQIYHADIYNVHRRVIASKLSIQTIELNMDSRVGGYYDASGKSLINETRGNFFRINEEMLKSAELVVLGGGKIEQKHNKIVVSQSSTTFSLPRALQNALNNNVADLVAKYVPNVIPAVKVCCLSQCCNDLGTGSCTGRLIERANNALQNNTDVLLKMFDGQQWSDGSGCYARNVYLSFKKHDGLITTDQLKEMIGGQYADGTFQASGPDSVVDLLKNLVDNKQANVVINQPGVFGVEVKGSSVPFDQLKEKIDQLKGPQVTAMSTAQLINFLQSLDSQK